MTERQEHVGDVFRVSAVCALVSLNQPDGIASTRFVEARGKAPCWSTAHCPTGSLLLAA